VWPITITTGIVAVLVVVINTQMKVRAGCCVRNFVVRHEDCSVESTRHEIKPSISVAMIWTRDMTTINADVIEVIFPFK
jgi:hypothetical protein